MTAAVPSPTALGAPVRAFTDPVLGFAGPPIRIDRPERATLADLIALVPLQRESIRPHLRVRLGGVVIDPALYHRVLPKLDARVDIVLPARGGKNGILGMLAVIALVGASVFVGAAGLPFLGSAFAAGSVGANLVAGGLSLAASLLLQGLNTPQQGSSPASREIGVASAQNAFEPGAYLQRVAGTRRVTPQMVMPPYSRIDGDDQIVTAVYGLAGPHQISSLKVGTADADGAADITYEVREGFPDDAALTLVTDTRIEVPLNLRLSQFRMKSTGDNTNDIDTSISPYVPQWHGVESKIGPDRVKLYFSFEQGLIYGAESGPQAAITAIRVRMRKKGATDWYNLPEFLVRGDKQNGALRIFLDFNWLAPGSMPGSVGAFTANYGGWSWKYDLVTNFGASVTYWTADSYFATNKVDWLNKQQVKVYLDTDTFSQDASYEFEVMRGYSTTTSALTLTSSTVHTVTANSLTSYDFYSTQVDGSETSVPNAQTRAVDLLAVTAIQSIWNEYPFDLTNQPTALIAIRARNRSLEQVTCVASGYVDDWNGASWVANQVTSNPASHYRYALRGELNAEPVPDSLIDSENLQDWHEWCASEGFDVNALLQGQPVDQCLSIIAQAGMARPRYGATYGVIVDRPREPVGLITQRNAAGFSFQKPFGRLPHALKVNLADESRDYEVRELIVYADGYNADGSGGLTEASRFESVTYQGITSEALAQRRALRDLRFARYRSMLHNFSMDIEHLEFQLGDLVLMETDILGQIGGRGRVKQVLLNGGGLVTGLVLDEQRDFTHADAGQVGQRWTFDSTAESFTIGNGSATTPGDVLRVTASTGDSQVISPSGLSIDGAAFTRIRARVRRVSGSGAWQGEAFYQTAGHGFSTSFRKTGVAAPASPSEWSVVEFDMSALTAGGTDWTTSTITRLRLDLWGNGDVFEVDYIELWGRLPRAVAMRLMDGTVRIEEVTADDSNRDAVTFVTPFAMPTDGSGELIEAGTLVATGVLGTEAREVLIWDIAPGPDLTAQVVAIDYADSAIYGALLLEDGGYILLEDDGGKLLVEEG